MATKGIPRAAVIAILLIAAGLIAGLLPGTAARIIFPASLVGAVISLLPLFRRTPARTTAAPGTPQESETLLIRTIGEQVSGDTTTIDLSVLGRHYRRGQWAAVERAVDTVLDNAIRLIRTRIDAQTVAVLFPTTEGGYKIRRYHSRSEHINQEAVIYPGVGVIGSFLKEGLKQLKLEEILTDSMTLHYYRKDAGVRSLMASPIVVEGVERGTIIVDSTEKAHFREEDHNHLAVVAELCGAAVYYAYLSTEHKIAHARLSAMSATERYFLQEHDLEAVLDKLAEIIPFAFQCTRMSISLKCPDTDAAVVKRAWGTNADALRGLQFPLGTKSLAGVIYGKNMALFRNFADDRYEIRYCDTEPRNDEFASFIAFPIGVEECTGVILMESEKREAFTEHSRDLLSRLVTSAGVAIEKIQILHRTNALATHDGLTGLNNHRQFQQLLKEAITRSGRYKDPLALVLCDIDYFKKINDSYGHRFGDTVLKAVAAKLQSSIREDIDTAARYGGEEFTLILEKMDAHSARETVDRIREQISAMPFQTPHGKEISVTMSFGIAIYIQHARNQETLIQNADKALYRAKENGRNRVELYYDPDAKTKAVPIHKA